ncbi:single-stranded-DNA-specific exonuclease RecJ [Candidatus Saccharibacteria bacterium]|nr:single-stranded-DNA-specific exonuclease RecJ [Candidatus Saccharibacteria bacterium]
MNKLFIRLLKARNLSPDFLHPKYEDLSDPFDMPDMKKAVERIKKAIKGHEKILIYGDYDADGVTASTLMEQALKLAGAAPSNLDIMLPDRFADGYGMSPRLVERAKKQGAGLIITVDCGSRNHKIINSLNELNIDSVVTDHHETDVELPKAVAIVNPKRKDCQISPELRDLAGVGVAFKVASALVQEGLIKEGQEKWLLDLVLIGTMCDSMPITGENRILGYYGIKVLEKTRRRGLRELMKNAGVNKLNSESIGFQIGPRINAAGRLESAEIALNLLRTDSASEAASLASRLEELNKKRKAEQLAAVKEIEKRGVSKSPVIVESGNWHEGIIGIVAGRLLETYKRPAFVLTETTGDVLKGSGRSFGEFNLASALANVGDSIVSGGGHAGAAGVRVKKANLQLFAEKLNDYYKNLNLGDQSKFLINHPDLEVDDFSDFTLDFLQDLKLLEPFGPGNEEPIFRLKNVSIREIRSMGAEGKHLRVDLKDRSGKPLKLVAFYAPESWLNLDPGYDHIEPLVKLVENDFNGVRSVEARIVDIDMI